MKLSKISSGPKIQTATDKLLFLPMNQIPQLDSEDSLAGEELKALENAFFYLLIHKEFNQMKPR
jgi:hypothetical protein